MTEDFLDHVLAEIEDYVEAEPPAVDPRYCVSLAGVWEPAKSLKGPKRQQGRPTSHPPQILRHVSSGRLAIPAFRKGWHWVRVSREDAWAADYAWFISKEGYVVRNLMMASEKTGDHAKVCRQRYLHREIMARVLEPENVPPPSEPGPYLWQPIDIDHRNRRRLDNTRANLRALHQSAQNRNQERNDHAMVGITWHAQKGRWWARIKHGGKDLHVGYFKSPKQARMARRRRLGMLGLPIDPASDHAPFPDASADATSSPATAPAAGTRT